MVISEEIAEIIELFLTKIFQKAMAINLVLIKYIFIFLFNI